MSGRVGDLSPQQAETLEKFWERVKDLLKQKRDDFYLLRWLRARQFNIMKAEEMIRAHYKWREENQINTILEDYKELDVIKKYYTGGHIGYDKKGSPVWIDPFGLIDMRGILHSCKKKEVIRNKVWVVESFYKSFREELEKTGRRREEIVVIFDLDKLGPRHLWKPGVDVFNEILKMFEDQYPETLKYAFIVNAPRLFPIVFKIVRPFLSEDTVKKTHVLGSNFKEVLLKYIDADQLPVHWGGTKVDLNGDPRCTAVINHGGMVPKELYHISDLESSNYTTASISRGSSLQLDFEITQPMTILRWEFKTENHDMGFGIFRRTADSRQKAGEMEVIKSTERVNSHLVPEDGTITCKEVGTYVVRFDNTFSIIRSKKVSYLIEILEPDNTFVREGQDSTANTPTQESVPGQGE
ncbi:hypothetical protein CHS0354_024391 [Potamilus streckersoni]|uniref:SEC14-like protein 2 n=1 Tax=Potamilus streckersoni TaxID=2493646 RepID=A0AAE0SWS2_9BIVA|nr:hypothetical protein CHS0354_024391 [Potamilus streckersoni]